MNDKSIFNVLNYNILCYMNYLIIRFMIHTDKTVFFISLFQCLYILIKKIRENHENIHMSFNKVNNSKKNNLS